MIDKIDLLLFFLSVPDIKFLNLADFIVANYYHVAYNAKVY